MVIVIHKIEWPRILRSGHVSRHRELYGPQSIGLGVLLQEVRPELAKGAWLRFIFELNFEPGTVLPNRISISGFQGLQGGAVHSAVIKPPRCHSRRMWRQG